MEISFVCVAARLTLAQESGVCETARIAQGAVAPTPLRAREADTLLEGQPITDEAQNEAAELAEATAPISDVRVRRLPAASFARDGAAGA
jgi:carbon-monoxide dehydrogenase medium subunit